MKKVIKNGKVITVTSLAARRMLHYGEATEIKEEKEVIQTKEEKRTRTTKAKK